MAFKGIDWDLVGLTDEERNKQTQEILENLNMATMDELFGGRSDKPKAPPTMKLNAVGETDSGVITAIDPQAQEYEFIRDPKPGQFRRPKYWVDRQPTPMDKKEAEEAGHRPVVYVALTVTKPDGTQGMMRFQNKADKDALKAAVAETGSLEVGDTIGRKVIEIKSNGQRLHAVKIVRQ